MKLVFLLIGLVTTAAISAQNRHALIVAVGEYPKNSRVPPIASVSDVPYIKAALHKHGFIDRNIDTLINAGATKAAILKSLTSLATKAKPGDIVVIHFAAHGQQIRDQRTVELGKDEDDGYDEAILPYDAQGSYRSPGYKGENHLRDDDLAPKLKAIRKSIGKNGSLLVLIDACHSGTGTRSESFGTSRGEPIPFPDPENPLEATVNISESASQDSFYEMSDSLGNMVVISGSGPHQENKQMIVNFEELGSLSYSFYKAMGEMPPHSTYRDLYEKIKATIQAAIPNQLPMLEGNGDQVIFSGTYKPRDEKIYLRVGVKNFSDGKEDSLFTVEKGLMDNITEGTPCKIYKNGDFVTSAVIRKSENFKSVGSAEKKLTKSDLYEIRFEEQSLGNFLAGLKIENSVNDQQSVIIGNQVAALVRPYRFITITDKADYLFEIKNRKAVLKDRNDRIVWSKELASGDTLLDTDKKEIITDIKKAMRVKYLRTMPDGGLLAGSVKVSVIPESGPDSIVAEPLLLGGQRYSLKIENNSDRKLFYTVIDILPDNSVDVLYPFRDKEPANYSIERGKEVIRKLGIPQDPVPGREVLKVIVSREPMDLRSVFARKKERSDNHSFQRTMDDLFKDSDDEKSTRADVSAISVEEIGIITVAFNVRKQ